MKNQVRVHIRTAVNSSKIRTEKRRGREVLVVPSATLPDNVVMNNIRYPAQAIEASYKTLERSLAPFGHPKTADGGFVSALDPEALSAHYIGAHNENVRRENGRVLMDKVIDVGVASSSEAGKRVLEAIHKGEAIHTSTGLMATLRELEDDPEALYEVEDMVFDHDAILLDEPGAATPDQGVGMLVNGQQVRVVNSEYEESLDRRLDYAVEEVARVIEARDRLPVMKRIKDTLLSILGTGEGSSETEDEKEAEVAFTPEEAQELKNSVENIQARLDKLTGDGTEKALANLGEAISQIQARFQAEDEAKAAAAQTERDDLEKEVVNQGLMEEEEAKTAPVEALRVLANNAKKRAAAPIVSHAFNQQRDNQPNLADLFPKEE